MLIILKIFISVVDFVYKNPNSNVIFNEILFNFTFLRNATSALFQDFKPNYLEKMRGYPFFSFWILIALAEIYFPCIVISRAKIPRY